MGNIRELQLVSFGQLTDEEHQLLKRELQPFSVVRGWHRVSEHTHGTVRELLTQLDKFNDVNSISEKVLKIAKRLRGNSYSSALVDMTDVLQLSRDMVVYHVDTLVKKGMMAVTPYVLVE